MSHLNAVAVPVPFVKKLRSGGDPTEEDVRALGKMVLPPRIFAPQQDAVSEGDQPRLSLVVVSGWACRYKQLQNGKRQLLSLLIPGDLSEPFGALAETMDHSIAAITALTVVPVDVVTARRLANERTELGKALWWDLLATHSSLYERILSLGRRSSAERLCHLFCELYYRLNRIGMVRDMEFDFPISQTDLGDLLGLSAVHVNRSLQDIRATGMLSLRDRRVKIHDLATLEDVSHFNPTYFHAGENVLQPKDKGATQ